MEKIELIEARGFGEKLNELTSLVHDNFVPLLRQSWWLLLGIGIVVALIVQCFPSENLVENWAQFLLLAFISLLVVITFVSLVRVVGIEQQSLPNRKAFFRLALVYGGRALPTLLLPFVVLCLMGGYAVALLVSIDVENKLSYFFLLMLLILVVILMAAPLFQLVNVCILEEKQGFAAISRMVKLRRYKRMAALAFYFIIVLLCLLVPIVLELPYLIFSVAQDVIVDEFGNSATPDAWTQIVEFIFTLIESCAFILYICLTSMATLLEYGNAVEVMDNVHFLEKFNNFDNL